jgi:hypothetical protein
MSCIFTALMIPQVEHFDLQQEASARRAKQLHNAIQQKGVAAAGSLAGKAQK